MRGASTPVSIFGKSDSELQRLKNLFLHIRTTERPDPPHAQAAITAREPLLAPEANGPEISRVRDQSQFV
jgi:hypothetical protein